MTCEAADPRAEKQLGAQPHTLQSREQVCLRVWGWVGHGSNAVGWGRVVPSNPRPGRPFWTSVTAPSLAAILWKPSHFVCNCPSRVPGSSARLVRGRPCKQLPKPAEGGGGRGSQLPRKSSKEQTLSFGYCNTLKSQRISNSSRIQRVFSPTPHNSFSPPHPWGPGRAFGKPRPETQGTLNHPHSFAKCSHHHVPKHSASNTVLHGGSAEHGSKGGLTLMWHHPFLAHPFPPPPPFPPSFTPTLPPSHPPT